MPPKIMKLPVVEDYVAEDNENVTVISDKIQQFELVWQNIIPLTFVHLAAFYGFYLILFKSYWVTVIFGVFIGIISGIGITAGYHRLWTHRSYKARLPLKILLLIMCATVIQNHVWYWVRIHRTHHKYADTNADPHNAKRGFFFSHIGWILIKPHPEAKAKSKTIDMSDLTSDPLLQLYKRYYVLFALLFGVIIPTYIPTLWGEPLWNSFFVCVIFRQIITLHFTFSVNSVAHMWGYKPYDKNIGAVENKTLSWVTFGEGGHNFHHAFPWDYKISEFGRNDFNVPKLFIDFMASIGWAYDLKSISDEMAQKRAQKTGDGSHQGMEEF